MAESTSDHAAETGSADTDRRWRAELSRLVPEAGLVKPLYNATLRKVLPEVIGVYNDVPAYGPRALDRTLYRPQFESNLKAATKAAVRDGDLVVIVGGGIAATTVWACEETGPQRVHTYEKEREEYYRALKTMVLNDIENTYLHHETVGWDAAEGVTQSVSGLPEHDVLILDCEGAELDILNRYAQYDVDAPAREVVVETHQQYGAPVERVRTPLERGGYRVESSVERAEDPTNRIIRAVRGELGDEH